MSGAWQENIAAIYDIDGVNIVGTGTLIETRQLGLCILTCAHVLNDARKVDKMVSQIPDNLVFRFSLAGREGLFDAKVVEWHPPVRPGLRGKTPANDIALLKVTSEVKRGVRPHSVNEFRIVDLQDRHVHSFGFSSNSGQPAFGKLQGTNVNGWLQFSADVAHDNFIKPGFSGAPLYASDRRTILGMVASSSTAKDEKVAFAISTKVLWQACPQLARPYRGLEEFGENNADFFFGRKQFVAELRSRLESNSIVGVTADSGLGKSSVVKAGLIPELKKERQWLIIQMRPDNDPWYSLASALDSTLYPGFEQPKRLGRVEKLAVRLKEKPLHLIEYIENYSTGSYRFEKVLILINQFEELFTLAGHGRIQGKTSNKKPVSNGASPSDFRDLVVATATANKDLSIQWIYTLRADFSGQAFRHKMFTETIGEGDAKLTDMDRGELREAIAKPAESLNVEFDEAREGLPSLDERIADAVTARSQSLPLMSHLLEKLWEKMSGRMLTHESYDALGGLEGSLNQHAEQVYLDELDKNQKALTRRLFSRLISISEDRGEVTRQICSRLSLGEDLWAVVQKLAEHRLLTIRGEFGGSSNPYLEAETITSKPEEPGALPQIEVEKTLNVDETEKSDELKRQTVEVAHEALLTHWHRLAMEWIPADKDFILWRQRLEQQIMIHSETGEDNDLLQGSRLVEAIERCIGPHKHLLNQNEFQFVEVSKIKNEQEEASKAKRKNIITTIVVAAILLAFTAGGAFTYQLNQEQLKTKEALLRAEKNLAAANELRILAESKTEEAKTAKALADEQKTEAEYDAARYAAAIANVLLTHDDFVKVSQGLLVVREKLPKNYSPDLLNNRIIPLVELTQGVARFDLTPGILEGHEGDINHAVFSPDGSRILTASRDNTARVWDAANGKMIHNLEGHEGDIVHAVFSPDGSRILTASQDRTARVWDAANGKMIHNLEGHEIAIVHAAFSPDGSRILTASQDRTARVWDAANGTMIHNLEGHDRVIFHAAFSPDGSRILTASQDRTARVWDAANGTMIHNLEGHEDFIYHATFSPDGSHILTASDDNTARVWDTANGTMIHNLEGHKDWIEHAAFSPDGSHILTASRDNTARVWDAANGTMIHNLEGHEDIIYHAAFSPDGSRILTASKDNTARVWDASNGIMIHNLEGHEDTILHAAFSPDGNRILTASQDRTARVWNASNGKMIHNLEGHEGVIEHAAFSPDGSRILTASRDNTARVWDASNGTMIQNLEGHEDTILHAAFSPDGSRILTASRDHTARVWDASNGTMIQNLEGHEGVIDHAAFSSDGSRILTASRDNTARVWMPQTGR